MNRLQDSNQSAQFLTDIKSLPASTRTISTHCTHPGCDARLHCFEEWAIGLCAFHANPELSPLPDTPEPDWQSWLSLIDDDLAAQETVATGIIPRPNRRA